MSDTTPKPLCAVCKGKYEEHFDGEGRQITIHVYTNLEGDLTTPQERAKQQGRQQTQSVNPAMLMSAGANPLGVGRLVELLVEKGVLSLPEALYIGMMGSKPQPEEASGFRDPLEAMRKG